MEYSYTYIARAPIKTLPSKPKPGQIGRQTAQAKKRCQQIEKGRADMPFPFLQLVVGGHIKVQLTNI